MLEERKKKYIFLSQEREGKYVHIFLFLEKEMVVSKILIGESNLDEGLRV